MGKPIVEVTNDGFAINGYKPCTLKDWTIKPNNRGTVDVTITFEADIKMDMHRIPTVYKEPPRKRFLGLF